MAVGAILAAVLGGGLAAGGSIGSAALSKPKQAQTTAGFNPLQGVLSNLFGVRMIPKTGGLVGVGPKDLAKYYKKGGTDPNYGFGFANPIFTPDSFDVLKELQTALPYNQTQLSARDLAETGRVGTGSEGFAKNINSVLDYLRGPLAGYADELARTGFKTSVEPIAAQARNNFNTQILPDIANRYGGYTNALSSDFAGSAQQAGSSLEYDIRALDTQLQEAANARRVTGIPLSQNIQTANVGLPFAISKTLEDLGSGFYANDTATRPGQQMLALIQALGGLATGQPFNGPTPIQNPGLATGRQAISDFLQPITQGAGNAIANAFTTPAATTPAPNTYNLPAINDSNPYNFTSLQS